MYNTAVTSSVSANNPRWLAPEAIATQSFSKAADVYSFGIVRLVDQPAEDMLHCVACMCPGEQCCWPHLTGAARGMLEPALRAAHAWGVHMTSKPERQC